MSFCAFPWFATWSQMLIRGGDIFLCPGNKKVTDPSTNIEALSRGDISGTWEGGVGWEGARLDENRPLSLLWKFPGLNTITERILLEHTGQRSCTFLLAMQPPPKWRGTCEEGVKSSSCDCDQPLWAFFNLLHLFLSCFRLRSTHKARIHLGLFQDFSFIFLFFMSHDVQQTLQPHKDKVYSHESQPPHTLMAFIHLHPVWRW